MSGPSNLDFAVQVREMYEIRRRDLPKCNHDTAMLIHDRLLAPGAAPIFRQQSLRRAAVLVVHVAAHGWVMWGLQGGKHGLMGGREVQTDCSESDRRHNCPQAREMPRTRVRACCECLAAREG